MSKRYPTLILSALLTHACGGAQPPPPEVVHAEPQSAAPQPAPPQEPDAPLFACPAPPTESTAGTCDGEASCTSRFEIDPPEASKAGDGSEIPAGGHYVVTVVADGHTGQCELDSPLPECASPTPGAGSSEAVRCSVPWLSVQTGCGNIPSFVGLAALRIEGCPRSVEIRVRHEANGLTGEEHVQGAPHYEIDPTDAGCGPCYVGVMEGG